MSDLNLQFFKFEHLPPHLQVASRPFAALANHIVQTLPENEQRHLALQKLIEAKDCAVRAALFVPVVLELGGEQDL